MSINFELSLSSIHDVQVNAGESTKSVELNIFVGDVKELVKVQMSDISAERLWVAIKHCTEYSRGNMT